MAKVGWTIEPERHDQYVSRRYGALGVHLLRWKPRRVWRVQPRGDHVVSGCRWPAAGDGQSAAQERNLVQQIAHPAGCRGAAPSPAAFPSPRRVASGDGGWSRFRWPSTRAMCSTFTTQVMASDTACASRRGRVPPLLRFALAFRVYPRTGAVSVQRPVPAGTSGFVLRVYER
jgi:hypothetical protein